MIKLFAILSVTFVISCNSSLVKSVKSVKYELVAKSDVDPISDNSVSSKYKKNYRRIMILPPSGSSGGEFSTYITRIESTFIKSGLVPISSAITGRVAKDKSGDDTSKTIQIPEIERVMLMAKSSKTDAVLQIGSIEDGSNCSRFFLLDNKKKLFEPTTYENYKESEFQKIKLCSPSVTLSAKLINVKEGEVTDTLDLTCNIAEVLPEDFELTIESNRTILSESNLSFDSNFQFGKVEEYEDEIALKASGQWVKESRSACFDILFEKVASKIKNNN